MSHIIAIVLRILDFPTETPVSVRDQLGDMLASRTTPASFVLGAGRPLDDAVQMDDVKAIGTGPRRLERFDVLTTDEALQTACVNLPHEFLTLRTLAGVLLLGHFQIAIRFELRMFLLIKLFG